MLVSVLVYECALSFSRRLEAYHMVAVGASRPHIPAEYPQRTYMSPVVVMHFCG